MFNMLSDEENDYDSRAALLDGSVLSLLDMSFNRILKLAHVQSQKTNTLIKKLYEYFKIQFLGYSNEFEKIVYSTEPNDCGLVSKYAKVCKIDLKNERQVTVDHVCLSSIHIPHPLIDFAKNNTENCSKVSVAKELEDSPVLVFIHGLGGQMSQFEPLLELLAQCLEIFAIDLPGFGNSKAKFSPDKIMLTTFSDEEKAQISNSIKNLSLEDFGTRSIVQIILRFIEQYIPANKKILFVGHSMGTHLCIKVGTKLPTKRIEGLILLSPPSLHNDLQHHDIDVSTSRLSLFKVFNLFPWVFNSFRIWDRLEGLESRSVFRQLSKTNFSSGENEQKYVNDLYIKLRQFRWNLDIDSDIILKYVKGFKKATYSEFVTTTKNFNDGNSNNHFQRTLLIVGDSDLVTPPKTIKELDDFLTDYYNRKVSSAIEISNAGHSLLLSKPEFVSGVVLNHIEQKFPEKLNLSPAWVLKLKAEISGDKWGLKNEMKWLKLDPISSNITRRNGKEVAPLLGMKTLRESDSQHSPALLEAKFYSQENVTVASETIPKGTLIAIVDISADIPPYSPKSFKHIKYYKCATVSKVVPDQIAVRKFILLLDDILASSQVENPLVAVHCHYGFNRTGYLICCYLIERLGWSVHEAVDGFRHAKYPGIKHQHFIDALYVKYEN